MVEVCPTITAVTDQQYASQMYAVSHFVRHIHIDLMDGEFAPTQSPALDYIWWPDHVQANIHLMYQRPMEQVDRLIDLKPHMVIIHNEANVHHMLFAAKLHQHSIKVGLALLQDTPADWAEQIMHSFDQVLIFSGHLGFHGGEADFSLLNKVARVKELYPGVEIAWDGGINADNCKVLIDAGVQVLNVGNYIQGSSNPQQAYAKIKEIIIQNDKTIH